MKITRDQIQAALDAGKLINVEFTGGDPKNPDHYEIRARPLNDVLMYYRSGGVNVYTRHVPKMFLS